MKKTEHYKELASNVRSIIEEINGLTYLLNNGAFKHLNTDENRSVIFEIINYNLIVKWMLPKGQGDVDIEALIDLDGLNYFPKLYAYQERTFLVMEKAEGESVQSLLKTGVDKKEIDLIRTQYKESVSLAIKRKRYDWDSKLEHLFWNKETNKLTNIDLGLYDKCFFDESGYTEAIEDCVTHFNRKIEEEKYH